MATARRRHAATAVAALCLTAACGTTVPTRPGAQAPGAVGRDGAVTEDLGAPAAPPAVGADGAVGVPGAAGGTAGPATTGGGGGAGGGTSGATRGGQSGAGPTASGGASRGTTPARPGGTSTAVGPGITADKVHVGVMYYPDAAVANAGLGAEGASVPDQRDFYNAVIDDVNKRGGVLGRTIAPIYFEYRSTSSEPADTQYQAACDHWTKDNKVFAITFRGRVLQECAMKAGALITSGDGEAGPTYARVPNLVDPAGVRLERLGQATVSGLNRDKYFAPTPEWPTGKVGVITWEDPSYKYGITEGYLPALKKLGITPTETRYIATAQNLNGVSDSSAAVNNAVLSFKDKKIDHVLIQDGAAGVFGMGGLTLLFLNNAKSQEYRPRYGFNANNVPGFDVYPADQQHGMLAVDFSDYMPTQDEGITKNAARERCFAIMRERGVGVSSQNTMATAAGACDGVWFIVELLRRAARPNLRGVLDAAASLGTSYQSPQVYGTRFGPGRRDGAELARNARFDDACGCMKYTSPPYAP